MASSLMTPLLTLAVLTATRHSPIIVGERYELAETVASTYGGDHYEGLLAKPDYQTALLSMSGYETYGATDVNDSYSRIKPGTWSRLAEYNVSRSTEDPMYIAYAQPGIAQTQAQPSSTHYDRQSDQMTYGINHLYQPRGEMEATRSQLGNYGARSTTEVKSYNPQQGNKGTHIYVFLRSACDLLAPTPLVISMLFATRPVSASLTRLEITESSFEYVVTADAPQHSDTGSSSLQVQIRLQLQEESGRDAGLLDVGYFEYSASELRSSPHVSTRKRKLSEGLEEPVTNVNASYSFAPFGNSAYPQSLHSVDLDSVQRRFTSYGRAQNQQRRGLQSPLNGILPSQSLMKPPTSQSSVWNSPSSNIAQSGRSIGIDSSHANAIAQISSPDTNNPTLMRTSTLQQSDSPGRAPTPSASNGFNPYTAYPQKAVLKIRGNLDSMTDNWTPEEWSVKRRLVQFWRSQNKSTINAEFAPVTPESRQPNSICISCIWWEERQECFATSVDTIYLLEQLVATRFSVEEKNRIRRNLEGYHPLTVSKAKPDSEEFFKIIMGFPNPKPRNIEKDVKVFPWKILAQSLKKIISKYSASYASTAASLHTPSSLIFTPYQSDQAADAYTKNLSSRSASDSATSSTYAPTLKSNTMSPSGSHGRSVQYSEATLSGSLPSLEYDDVPSVPGQYRSSDQEYMTQASVPSLTHSYTAHSHQRPDSRGGYDSPRHFKRTRANTSAESYYSSHDEVNSSLGDMSRSFSEQPTPKMSLPSLTEAYTLPSSEPRYEHSAPRRSYDLSPYIGSPTGAIQGQAHGMPYQEGGEENTRQAAAQS